jgi:hypothetical protein
VSLAAVAAVVALLLTPAQDGRWSGRLEGGSKAAKLSFQVTRDGRRIERFRTTVAAFCVGPTIETNRIEIFVFYVPRTSVRSNGRFSGVNRPNAKAGGGYRIRGTLRGNRVRDGRVTVAIGTCGGQDGWTARRARR